MADYASLIHPAKLGGTYKSIIAMANKTDTNAAWMEQERGLTKLVGARLSSVQFVLDYLILGFDERGALTTLVWPEILKKNARLTIGMDQYRNELCSLIKYKVATAIIEQDETISIQFDNDTKLRVALRSYQGSGERAILTAPNHYLLVF